jgi:hypothetical protein
MLLPRPEAFDNITFRGCSFDRCFSGGDVGLAHPGHAAFSHPIEVNQFIKQLFL